MNLEVFLGTSGERPCNVESFLWSIRKNIVRKGASQGGAFCSSVSVFSCLVMSVNLSRETRPRGKVSVTHQEEFGEGMCLTMLCLRLVRFSFLNSEDEVVSSVDLPLYISRETP